MKLKEFCYKCALFYGTIMVFISLCLIAVLLSIGCATQPSKKTIFCTLVDKKINKWPIAFRWRNTKEKGNTK